MQEAGVKSTCGQIVLELMEGSVLEERKIISCLGVGGKASDAGPSCPHRPFRPSGSLIPMAAQLYFFQHCLSWKSCLKSHTLFWGIWYPLKVQLHPCNPDSSEGHLSPELSSGLAETWLWAHCSSVSPCAQSWSHPSPHRCCSWEHPLNELSEC